MVVSPDDGEPTQMVVNPDGGGSHKRKGKMLRGRMTGSCNLWQKWKEKKDSRQISNLCPKP